MRLCLHAKVLGLMRAAVRGGQRSDVQDTARKEVLAGLLKATQDHVRTCEWVQLRVVPMVGEWSTARDYMLAALLEDSLLHLRAVVLIPLRIIVRDRGSGVDACSDAGLSRSDRSGSTEVSTRVVEQVRIRGAAQGRLRDCTQVSDWVKCGFGLRLECGVLR
jgi:hypothetical protein